MDGVDELITWLRQQLDDDEAHARNAFGDHNNADAVWCEQWSGALNIGDAEDLILTNDSQISRFMERFDPARALAEVDAKRAIVAAFEQREEESQHPGGRVFGYHATGLLIAIRHLPAAIADRPGYREEWRP